MGSDSCRYRHTGGRSSGAQCDRWDPSPMWSSDRWLRGISASGSLPRSSGSSLRNLLSPPGSQTAGLLDIKGPTRRTITRTRRLHSAIQQRSLESSSSVRRTDASTSQELVDPQDPSDMVAETGQQLLSRASHHGAPGSVARWDSFAAAPGLAGPGRRSSLAAPPTATTALMRELRPWLIRLAWQDPCYSFPLSAGDVPCARL